MNNKFDKNKNLLLNFIINEVSSESEKDIIEQLRYELDKHIYYFGNHFKSPQEQNIGAVKWFKTTLVDYLNLILCCIKHYFELFFQKEDTKTKILNSAYFNIDKKVSNYPFVLYRLPWVLSFKSKNLFDVKLYWYCKKIKKQLKYGNYRHLISNDFIKEVTFFKGLFKTYIQKNNFQALFLPQDIGFFEKLSIEIFKELKKPTFSFIHGLPGHYNKIDYKRTDYLVVWGETIKNNFISYGFEKKHIFVSGHPLYERVKKSEFNFDLNKILVLSKPMVGSQFSESLQLCDRSNSVYYLYSIQKVLSEFGVKSVRLRLHPSENPNWYIKFIDTAFFKIDIQPLDETLLQSTLVVGGTSTVFLEAMYYGLNYIVYEPLNNNKLLDGDLPVPPFDGSDDRVLLARNEYDLRHILKNRSVLCESIYNDYIAEDFNLDFLKKIIINKEEI